MTPADQARLLAAKADEDLHVLKALRDDPNASDAIWGFHAQQAVEKFLKAFLARSGMRFPFTHRLLELADLLSDAKIPLGEQFEPLLDLTPYAVEYRYSLLVADPDDPPLDRKWFISTIEQLRVIVLAAIEGGA